MPQPGDIVRCKLVNPDNVLVYIRGKIVNTKFKYVYKIGSQNEKDIYYSGWFLRIINILWDRHSPWQKRDIKRYVTKFFYRNNYTFILWAELEDSRKWIIEVEQSGTKSNPPKEIEPPIEKIE